MIEAVLRKSEIDEFLGYLNDTTGAVDPGPQKMVGVIEDAYHLATAAYVNGDNEALGRAERLLTLIHERSCFSPPIQAIPSVYWSVLMRAKLRAMIRRVGGPTSELSAEEMKQRLTRAVEVLGCYHHPFLDEVLADTSRKGVLVYTKNLYASCHGFSRQITMISNKCPVPARQVIVSNLSDELKGTPHIQLRERFLAAAGGKPDPNGGVDDPDRVTASFAVLNYRCGVSVLSNPAAGLGLFYSVERNWQLETTKMYPGLLRLGFNAHDIELLDVHSEIDERHAEEWMDMMIGTAALTPRDRGIAVDSALANLCLRRDYYDAMRLAVYGKETRTPRPAELFIHEPSASR